MSIRMTCPGCEEQVNLSDALAGKKVRCKECGEVFTVKKGTSARTGGLSSEDSWSRPGKLREEDEKPSRSRRRHDDDDDDDDDDQPRFRRHGLSSFEKWWLVIYF